MPDEIGEAVIAFFGPDARLAVRSSANGEDLEHLAGAGLYDSVVNVSPPGRRRRRLPGSGLRSGRAGPR